MPYSWARQLGTGPFYVEARGCPWLRPLGESRTQVRAATSFPEIPWKEFHFLGRTIAITKNNHNDSIHKLTKESIRGRRVDCKSYPQHYWVSSCQQQQRHHHRLKHHHPHPLEHHHPTLHHCRQYTASLKVSPFYWVSEMGCLLKMSDWSMQLGLQKYCLRIVFKDSF